MLNPILTAGNAYLIVTNLAGAPASVQTLTGIPIGTSDGSATGSLGVKIVGAGTGGAISVTSTPQTATLAAPTLLGASATGTIPVGAKGYQISILTGTATVQGTALIPAGANFSSNNTVAATITVTTASTSSALLAWET